MGFWGFRRRQIILNTKDGNTFRGILYRKTGPLLELRNAELMSPEGRTVPMDGALLVERVNVSYFQVVT